MQKSYLSLIAMVTACASLCSCSIIGFGLGAIEDATTAEAESIYIPNVRGLGIGKNIRVFTLAGDSLSGEFRGVVLRDRTEYTRSHAAARTLVVSQGNWLPELGQTVTITDPPLKPWKVVFLSFDYYGLLLGSPGRDPKRNTYEVRPTSFYRMLDEQGNSTDSTALANLFSQRAVPFASAIVIQNSVSNDTIPIDRLSRIERFNFRSNKWVGLGAGAAADALAVLLFALGFHIHAHM